MGGIPNKSKPLFCHVRRCRDGPRATRLFTSCIPLPFIGFGGLPPELHHHHVCPFALRVLQLSAIHPQCIMTAFFNKLLGGSGPAETDNIIPLPDYQTAVQNNHNSHPENPGTPRVNYVRPETLIVTPEGNDGLWPQMPSCDFVTFLAIIQSLGVAILHFEPNLSKNSRRGDRVKVVHLRGGKGMVFKSEFRNQHISESDANRKLLPEIMVLGNPRLNKHPNMHEMLGVTLQPVFDPPRPGMSAAQCAVVPHLVFAECKYGSLWDFVTRSRKRPLSLLQKLRLCSNIAEAVKAMHKLSKASNPNPVSPLFSYSTLGDR